MNWTYFDKAFQNCRFLRNNHTAGKTSKGNLGGTLPHLLHLYCYIRGNTVNVSITTNSFKTVLFKIFINVMYYLF